ncbi:hypothetical protein CMUS01_12147 [Colletotrichum musicola]|uniref:Uncharacterized protein n=1 Tax=Colletotrichum musicola TaxID=2175873 RepID=A0A8H6JQZ1_9PEZI|nr:hypothetical protein CMUS01_12147 [Colletotrichum musicola]
MSPISSFLAQFSSLANSRTRPNQRDSFPFVLGACGAVFQVLRDPGRAPTRWSSSEWKLGVGLRSNWGRKASVHTGLEADVWELREAPRKSSGFYGWRAAASSVERFGRVLRCWPGAIVRPRRLELWADGFENSTVCLFAEPTSEREKTTRREP